MGRKGSGTPRDRAASLREAAADVFGWDTLLPEQATAMEWVLDGEDTLVVMPTGSGKSAVYQVPAVLLPGPVVVVSPLLALQRDQIAGLPQGEGAPGAVAINSDLGATGTREAWEAVERGEARLLYLSPEQLAKDDVLERLAAVEPALFVVDEAQCVSSWGHDFRPDYLRLEQAVRRVGRPPVLALTATAASPVRKEIAERLGMRRPRLMVTGFDRPNIRLEVRRFLDDEERRRTVVERAAAEPKPGIVYAGTRKDSEHFARELGSLGLTTEAYHAGMRAAERERIHDAFLSGEADVVVATSAFGMGIDKEDVRFVLHASLPGSLDAYYQEIGRCGRDGDPALAVLHYRSEDTGMQTWFAGRTPGRDTLSDVARAVHEHGDDPAGLDELREDTGLSRNRVTAAVNLLQEAEAVDTGEDGEIRPAGGVTPEEAAEEAARTAQAHRRTDRTRVEMARAYAETTGCRRQFLLGYFGEEHEAPCGNCDLCDGDRDGQGPGERPEHPAAAVYPVGTEVRHEQWGDGTVLSEDQDRITVFFAQAGYRTLALEAVAGQEGLLTVLRRPGEDRWSD
ncbi:RecQ family ATP-dependent DNA helicase [Streptomyces sp. NPDC017943]|uniref:RecQ family ATP-dependent DNA helicase n=1 Tax=Streptomyces sp. NPDC017943 TaxID=3365019 RepID=UPI0037A57643